MAAAAMVSSGVAVVVGAVLMLGWSRQLRSEQDQGDNAAATLLLYRDGIEVWIGSWDAAVDRDFLRDAQITVHRLVAPVSFELGVVCSIADAAATGIVVDYCVIAINDAVASLLRVLLADVATTTAATPTS